MTITGVDGRPIEIAFLPHGGSVWATRFGPWGRDAPHPLICVCPEPLPQHARYGGYQCERCKRVVTSGVEPWVARTGAA